MKEEDIFGINSYEICSEFANSRLKFALARKYRLDHYAKTIGVNFSLFTAAFGYATFVALAVDTPSLKDDLADGNVRLLAEIDAFNFDTGFMIRLVKLYSRFGRKNEQPMNFF